MNLTRFAEGYCICEFYDQVYGSQFLAAQKPDPTLSSDQVVTPLVG
jgi:hypothetical protein